MKLAVVGGGSTYTPELVAGLASERERLDLRELILQDIDPERREVVGGLAERMLGVAGYDGKFSVTDDLDAAVEGASFVLIQLRVGGQEARLSDETVPLPDPAGEVILRSGSGSAGSLAPWEGVICRLG